MIPDKVCLVPFVSIATHPAGYISRCMMSSLPMGSMSDKDVWNNDRFQTLRQNMVNGVWDLPGCNTCHEREEKNLVSQRINWKTGERWWNGDIWDNKDFATSITGNKIYHLYLNTSNLCNFKCRMCNSMYSNSWINDDQLLADAGFDRKIQPEYNKNTNNLVEFINDNIDKLNELRMITVTGGEPFFNDDLLDALELLDLTNVHLSITTNGSLLTEQHLERLKFAKKVNINISIDGTGKLFEYMRGGDQCSWEKINQVIAMIKSYQKEHDNFVFSPNASFQIYNMLNVEEFYDWAESIITRPHEWIEFRLLTHPECLNVDIAPEYLKVKSLKQLIHVESKYKGNEYFINNMRKMLVNTNVNQKKHWQDFQKFTETLDKKRNQSLKDVAPRIYEQFTI